MSDDGRRSSGAFPRLNYFRLTRPKLKNWIRRDRLTSRFRGAGSGAKLTVVCADAGYGKTTLLGQLADASDARVVWYRLDASDSDLAQFLAYVVAGLRGQFPHFAASSDLDDGQFVSTAAPDHVAFLLAHELNALEAAVVVVLDNYERVNGSSDVTHLIGSLLDIMPEQVQLIIGTRQRLNLPLSLLRSRQELVELGNEDLALTPVEIRDLLAQLHNVALEDDELRVVAEKTEGWAAGVVMVAQYLHHVDEEKVERFLRDLSGETRVVYDYLMDEVFRRQDSDTQAFLIRTAVLPRLYVDVCNALMAIANAQEVLASLEARRLFTIAVDGVDDCFRYHFLFREFLLAQLRRRLKPDEIRVLHSSAAAALEARGDPRDLNDAQQLYVLAGDYDAAANLIERVAEGYLDSGRVQTVMHWLDSIPEEIASTRPWLQAIRGKALRRADDEAAAQYPLERAFRLFQQRNDRRGLVWVAYELSNIHYHYARSALAVQMLEQLLGSVAEDPISRARLLTGLCTNYLDQGDLGRAVRCGELALEELADLARDSVVTRFCSLATRRLAQAYVQQGNLHLALRSIDQTLDLCRLGKLGNLDKALTLCTHGQVLALMGDFRAALGALQSSEDLDGRYYGPLRSGIDLWRGNIYRDCGDYTRAAASYERAGDRALAERAHMYLRLGQNGQAMSAVRMAVRTAENGSSPIDEAIARGTLGLVLGAQGHVREAREELGAAIATFEEKGARQRLASLHLHLAHLELTEGSHASGLEHLDAGLGISASLGLCHFNWWDPAKFAFLVGQAIRDGIQVDQVGEILWSKLRGEYSAQLTELLSSPDAKVREFVSSIGGDLADETRTDSGLSESLISGLLKGCNDPVLRRRLQAYVRASLLTIDGLTQLRSRYGLTWREVEVFCVYYLRSGDDQPSKDRGRSYFARELCMSENTLKVHVSSIRHKLGLKGGPENPFHVV